ncbi:MAG: hypothetical protein ACTSVO_10360 [Candidatus Heimdallarchaeaceae archaeon]
MSEKPKDDPQKFSEFISLTNKIEEIVDKTPDIILESDNSDATEDEQETKEDEIITESDEGKQFKSESEQEIEDVEKQTTDLEKQIDVVQKEATTVSKEKRLEDITKIEKALSQLFEKTSISVHDFYYVTKEVEKEDLVKKIKGRLHSLESIKITQQETLNYPFALCKLDNSFKAVLPLELDGILLPTYLSGDKKQLKLLAVGKKEFKEIEIRERENLIQAINKIQMNLVKLLNRDSKERLSKEEVKKTNIIELDEKVIHDYITDYEKKMSKTHSYHSELVLFLNRLKETFENDKQIWEESDFEKVLQEIRPQLKVKQEEYTVKGRDAKVNFIKLKRTQKQIGARTKRLQIDEKRGKKVTREQKEELINQLRKFQAKKKKIQDSINETKKQEDVLEKWIEVFSAEDISEINAKVISYFGDSIIRILEEAIQNQNIETVLDETARIKSVLEAIIVHVIYVPMSIVTFSAKQANQDMEGKLLYFEPTGETKFLKPTIN